MPDYGGQWKWSDETERVVSRLIFHYSDRGRCMTCKSTKWFVSKAMCELGAKASLNEVAAAVAWHSHEIYNGRSTIMAR